MSDALHDHADQEFLRNRRNKRRTTREQKREPNERDKFYGPDHPIKVKYRDMNCEATKLFIKSRKDAYFFDQFSQPEVINGRDAQFQENLLNVYKRSRKNANVPEDLIISMQ